MAEACEKTNSVLSWVTFWQWHGTHRAPAISESCRKRAQVHSSTSACLFMGVCANCRLLYRKNQPAKSCKQLQAPVSLFHGAQYSGHVDNVSLANSWCCDSLGQQKLKTSSAHHCPFARLQGETLHILQGALFSSAIELEDLGHNDRIGPQARHGQTGGSALGCAWLLFIRTCGIP